MSSNLVYNDDKNIKLDAHLKQSGMPLNQKSKNEGSGMITLTVLNNPPLSINGKYQADPTSDSKKGSATLNVNYGEKKSSIDVSSEFLPDLTFFSSNIKIKTPIEKVRDLEVLINHKVNYYLLCIRYRCSRYGIYSIVMNNIVQYIIHFYYCMYMLITYFELQKETEGQIHNTDVSATVNNNKYTIKSEIKIDPVSPKIHLIFTCPAGKTEILSKFTKLGENEIKGI